MIYKEAAFQGGFFILWAFPKEKPKFL